jgi:predicted phage tail protein
LDRKLINERYKIIGDKENKNEKISTKDKINELRYNSMQLAEKRNKITLSTKIVNNKAFGEANKIISNSKEKEKPIDLIATNTINTINGNEKDKYDFHRQMNIFSSILNGVKTDEQIEEENNILLKCNDD